MASHQLNSINNYTLYMQLVQFVKICLFLLCICTRAYMRGRYAYLVFTMLLLFTFISLITRGQYIYAGVYNIIFLIPYYKRDLYIIH